MKKHLLSFCAATLLVAPLASAQASRTWVSGVGDDANPCSRTAPGKTFPGAISKTAAGGIINVLDPGGFGTVTITKAITIDGGNIPASVLAGGTNGIIINAGPTDVVVLRHLQVEGISAGSSPALSGIKILCAGAVYIEDCDIEGFKTGIEETTSASGGTQIFIKNSRIHENSVAGITMTPGAGVASAAILDHVHLEGNGLGISAAARATASLNECVIAFNSGAGISHSGTGAVKSYRNNVLTGNSPDGAPNGTLFQK